MAEQTCKGCSGQLIELYVSDWDTNEPDERPCSTCQGTGVIERTGPYRLADGTWSDGVDRTWTIPSHQFSKLNPDRVYVHSSYDCDTINGWPHLFDVWRGDLCIKTGWPFAEAIRYADKLARTTKNGDNND